MMQTAEQFVNFGQGNVEALVKSSQIFATGLQDLGKLMAAGAQATMDAGPFSSDYAEPRASS